MLTILRKDSLDYRAGGYSKMKEEESDIYGLLSLEGERLLLLISLVSD